MFDDIAPRAAKLTVKFGRHVTGTQVIAAVKALAEESGDEYHEDKGFDDGWRYGVGRKSPHPERPAVVIADRDTPYLEPGTSYTQVVIVSHDLPGPIPTFSPGHDANIETVVASIQQYGGDLRERARYLADRDDPPTKELVPSVVLDEQAPRQTIDLGRPTSGHDVVGVISRASETRPVDGAVSYQRHAGGRCQAGLTGVVEHQNLVVLPEDGGYIDTDQQYRTLVVASQWLSPHPVSEPSSPEQKAQAVADFATALRSAVEQERVASIGLDRGPATRAEAGTSTAAGSTAGTSAGSRTGAGEKAKTGGQNPVRKFLQR
ncbi:hypothetical protein ACXJJ3_06515 [Kribbella sp. WER1]